MKTPTARKYGTPYKCNEALKNELLVMAEHKSLMDEAQRKADDINKNCPDVKAIVRNDATICFITGDKYKVDTIQPEGHYDYSNLVYIGFGLVLVGLIVFAAIFGQA